VDYHLIFGGNMLNKKEYALQAKAIAELRRVELERKSKNVVKCGANLHSQWGQVVQNESRLIDNGHYMKSADQARLSFVREEVKKARKADKQVNEIRIIKKV
jgi:hypothetical protein